MIVLNCEDFLIGFLARYSDNKIIKISDKYILPSRGQIKKNKTYIRNGQSHILRQHAA